MCSNHREHAAIHFDLTTERRIMLGLDPAPCLADCGGDYGCGYGDNRVTSRLTCGGPTAHVCARISALDSKPDLR